MNSNLLIMNSSSGRMKDNPDLQEQLTRLPDTTICNLTSEVDLKAVISQAIDQGLKCLISAGGDGTVNAIVNTLMSFDKNDRPVLGILPVGTANDFAGTLDIPDEIDLALGLFQESNLLAVDVISACSARGQQFFANVATGGNSVKVSELITDELKSQWGPFCYARGAIEVLANLESYNINLNYDNQVSQQHSTWSILIANGQTNAGRLRVAPKASPIDGLMDIIIVEDGSFFDAAEIGTDLVLGNFLEHPLVHHRQARKLTFQSRPVLKFSLDGEPIDDLIETFEIIPGAIRMFVGPEMMKLLDSAKQAPLPSPSST